MSQNFEEPFQYIQDFILSLKPGAEVQYIRDFVFRVLVDDASINVSFPQEAIEDFQDALKENEHSKYRSSIESDIRFHVYSTFGAAGLIPHVSVTTKLLHERRDWSSQIRTETRFNDELCAVLVKGLKRMSFSLDHILASGQSSAEIEEELKFIKDLLSYHDKNGHLNDRGVSVRSISYLKSALVCMIYEKEQKRVKALVPRVLKSIDHDVYQLVTKIRREPFLNVALPDAIHDHIRLQGTDMIADHSEQSTAMNAFRNFPSEKAAIEKDNGETAGPYKMIFAGDTIMVQDKLADIDVADVIIRKLPNGKDKSYTVTKATFYEAMSSIPAHYQVKFEEGRMPKSEAPSQTINIHAAQGVQIGHNNTQEITNAIQTLVNQIENSDASDTEKEEAKSLLQEFLKHPLVSAITGAAIGLGG